MKKIIATALLLAFALPAFAQTTNITLQQKLQSDGVYQPIVTGQVAGPLRRGSKGPLVTTLQTILRDAGYFGGTIDGSYGRMTLAAVSAFQKSHGLSADGTWGPKSLVVLLNMVGGATTVSTSPSTTPSAASGFLWPTATTGFASSSSSSNLGSNLGSGSGWGGSSGSGYVLPPDPTPTPAPSACPTPNVTSFTLTASSIDISASSASVPVLPVNWRGCGLSADPTFKLDPVTISNYGTTTVGMSFFAGKNINPTASVTSSSTGGGSTQLAFDKSKLPSGTYSVTATWTIGGTTISKSASLSLSNSTFNAADSCKYSVSQQSTGTFKISTSCMTPITVTQIIAHGPTRGTSLGAITLSASGTQTGISRLPASDGTYTFTSPGITIPAGLQSTTLSFTVQDPHLASNILASATLSQGDVTLVDANQSPITQQLTTYSPYTQGSGSASN
ncbi:MAG: hypothetical protein JWM20_358 [Patescibacteria group bacterium]|nr:hypothetical protein [Patescibacteria group bacterium]